MKRKGMTRALLGVMAVAPSLIDSSKEIREDLMKAGKKSSKMIRNKMKGRKTTALIVTGIGGYLLAHAAPIKKLIREG